MVSRNDLLEERLLRDNIRSMLKVALQKRSNSSVVQESELRQTIRNILLEKVAVPDKVPHPSTAINVLEDLLKKIVPVIKTDYKSLTTSPEQRKSFRAHLVNGIEKLLAPSDVNIAAPDRPANLSEDMIELTLDEQDINVDLDSGADKDKFIDVDPPEPNEKDEFGSGLEDQNLDTTGRNMAQTSLNKFQKAIVDTYDVLDNDKDRDTFEDYLKTNVLLYLDKFESELTAAGSLPEPTTPEYEQETTGVQDELPPMLEEYINLNI